MTCKPGDFNSGETAVTATNAVTGAAFGVSGALSDQKLTVTTITSSASKTYDKNLAAGTYYVTAKFKGDDGKMVTVGGSFTVKDTQDTKVSFDIVDNAFVNGATTYTVAQAFDRANTNAAGNPFIKVYYDGLEKTNISSSDILEVKGNVLANGGAYIKTVKLYVTVSGSVGNKVPVTLNVNDQIAKCDVTGITE